MAEKHEHESTVGIIVVLVITTVLIYGLWFGFIIYDGSRIDAVQDRLDVVEQRIGCAAPEVLFYDVDDNEVCLEPAD